MLKTTLQKSVTTGFLIAIGILLPMFVHSIFPVFGSVFLPMHIPVFLCGFLCGPMYAAISGFILPLLSSVTTSMPAFYPNAIVMSFELLTYGLITATMYKFFKYSIKPKHIYAALITAMLSGRIVYGIVSAILLFLNPALKNLSVITAVVRGIPGIITHLIFIPVVITQVNKFIKKNYSAIEEAIQLVVNGSKTCVVVKENKIICSASPKGIYYIINLYEKGKLNNAFVADTVIGKAAAMVLSLAGVNSVYGQTMSREAYNWLKNHNIEASYSQLTDYIINRKGDGMCPMEKTVINIDDENVALVKLKEKIEELKKSSEFC